MKAPLSDGTGLQPFKPQSQRIQAVTPVSSLPRSTTSKEDADELADVIYDPELARIAQTGDREAMRQYLTRPPSWEQGVVSVNDFLAEDIPPRKLLLAPWLPEAGIVLLYAFRGIGKTLVAHEIACAVASGQGLWDWKPSLELDPVDGQPVETPRKVLIIDGELPQVDMQRRLKMTLRRYPGAQDNISLYMADRYWMTGGSALNLADPIHHEAIMAMAEGVDLVVIDNLSSLHHSGESESDDSSWQAISGLLLALRASGTTTLMIHHSGKGGKNGRGADQRGTSRREDNLDTSVRLERPANWSEDDPPEFEWHWLKTRGFSGEPPLAIRPVFMGGEDKQLIRWEWEQLKTRLQQQILELSREGLSRAEIARELECSKRYVQKVLN